MKSDRELHLKAQVAKGIKRQIESLLKVEPMTVENGLAILTLAHRRLDLIEEIEDALMERERKGG